MSVYTDLAWPAKRRTLVDTVSAILEDGKAWATKALAYEVAGRLEIGQDVAARDLLKLASAGDYPWVSRSGEKFKAYGRINYRLEWRKPGATVAAACPAPPPCDLDQAWREISRRLAALEQYDLIDQLASLLLPSDADDLSDLIGD